MCVLPGKIVCCDERGCVLILWDGVCVFALKSVNYGRECEIT